MKLQHSSKLAQSLKRGNISSIGSVKKNQPSLSLFSNNLLFLGFFLVIFTNVRKCLFQVLDASFQRNLFRWVKWDFPYTYFGPTVEALVLQWRTVVRQPWGWGRWAEVLFGSGSPSLGAALWERVEDRWEKNRRRKIICERQRIGKKGKRG